MIKIEILGTGCMKCNLLERTAQEAAERLGLEFELEHVRDISEFIRRGVLFTPAMAVDGRVVVAGKVPGLPEMTRLLSESLVDAR